MVVVPWSWHVRPTWSLMPRQAPRRQHAVQRPVDDSIRLSSADHSMFDLELQVPTARQPTINLQPIITAGCGLPQIAYKYDNCIIRKPCRQISSPNSIVPQIPLLRLSQTMSLDSLRRIRHTTRAGRKIPSTSLSETMLRHRLSQHRNGHRCIVRRTA